MSSLENSIQPRAATTNSQGTSNVKIESDVVDLETLSALADTFIKKFGGGNHKPGSGSAVALQGMLAVQLIETVIDRTLDPAKKPKFEKSRSELEEILTVINNRIYPELEKLFREDSIKFHQVFELRTKRDNASDEMEHQLLTLQAKEALRPATEIPIEIAKLCIELADDAIVAFDRGFKAVRGDASVALNNAVSAIAGCIAIADLNLLSFDPDEWTNKIRVVLAELRTEYHRLTLQITARLDLLDSEVTQKNENFLRYQEAVSLIQSGRWMKAKISYKEIEELATLIQNTLWINRAKLWKKNMPESPIQVLQPDVVLRMFLDYRFQQETTLGQESVGGKTVEIAGIIDKQMKVVVASQKFPIETRYFTVAHELGHALLHEGITQHRDRPLDGSEPSDPRNQLEVQADKFAAFFLMPKKQVLRIFEELFQTDKFVINDRNAFELNQGSLGKFRASHQSLRDVARFMASATYFNGKPFRSIRQVFQVSQEAMAIRLEELQLLRFS